MYLASFKNYYSIWLYFIVSFLAHLDLSLACAKIVEPLCLLEAWRAFNPPNWVLQITFGRYILPVLRTTTLFGSFLLFLLSGHLDLSMACAKIMNSLCLLEAWKGLNVPYYSGSSNISVNTCILPVLRTTTLFGSFLLFLLSAHLDLSMACAKIVEPLCLY